MITKERIYLHNDRNTLYNEITVIDHAMTRPYFKTQKTFRNPNRCPAWHSDVCSENNTWVKIGNEPYMLAQADAVQEKEDGTGFELFRATKQVMARHVKFGTPSIAMLDNTATDSFLAAVTAEPGRHLGGFLARYDATALPQDVVTTTKLFILDTLGVMAGGTRAPGIQELAQAVRAMEPGGGGIATVLIGGCSASPASAALINAATAHALDFDDTHDTARVHAFSIVLPAALAAAELRGGCDGRALLAAVALGSEVFCRLGLAGFNTLARGWHPTTSYGSLAAAIAAGRILDLSAEQMTNALGLAYVQMSGTAQSIIDGVLSKRLGPGIAARNGLLAAQLARFGLTGPWRFLEGEAGLFHLYLQDEVRPEFLVEALGHVWHMLNLSMKPFPCCRCSHALIQIGIELHRQGLKPQQIRSGRLLLGAVNHAIVGAAYDPAHANPVVHAQFNATYAFCRALIDGEVAVGAFSPDGVRGFADTLPQRIRCEIADDLPADALAPARIELTLADGLSVTMSRETMKGAPDEPMTIEEILAKFDANMHWGLRARKEDAEAISRLVLSLEAMEDARALAQTFRAATTL